MKNRHEKADFRNSSLHFFNAYFRYLVESWLNPSITLSFIYPHTAINCCFIQGFVSGMQECGPVGRPGPTDARLLQESSSGLMLIA